MKIGSAHYARVVHGNHSVNVPKKKEPSAGDKAQADVVIISEEARAQLARLADEARVSPPPDPIEAVDDGIRIDKIKLAMERIASGYYDRPDIREQIAGRLVDDVLGQPPDDEETPEQP